MKLSLVSLLSALASLVGCQHTQPITPQRAIIEQTTPTMKAEIQQAIVKLKGGIEPVISDTVFMRSSELLLEHGRSEAKMGQPILGAHSLPIQGFILQLREEDCALYYPKSQKYVLLKTVACKVEEKR